MAPWNAAIHVTTHTFSRIGRSFAPSLSQLIGSTLALEYMRAEYVAPLGSSSLVSLSSTDAPINSLACLGIQFPLRPLSRRYAGDQHRYLCEIKLSAPACNAVTDRHDR
jgi:hypothetical protein